ncbi:MAG: DUF4159 domain-containing protein [Phycisphaerae bacterium]|nr:DUF4159 domain-containing protein [Phycisphaerae bacterium]
MRHSLPSFLVLGFLLAATATVTAADRDDSFSDAAVDKAIADGVRYLCESQKGAQWPHAKEHYPQGCTPLAAYAILESLDYVKDDALRKRAEKAADRALKWMAERQSEKTYVLGLRCQAFLSAIKRGKAYHKPLRADADRLIRSTKDGSYGYDSRGEGKSSGDNSNSQYGLLGVWGARMVGWEIPKRYWQKVYAHWYNSQQGDGGWKYYQDRAEASSGTMVTAGVASMYVCFDNIFVDQFSRCNLGRVGKQVQASLQRGLDWLDRNYIDTSGDKPTLNTSEKIRGHGDMYYYLYGIERVGVASGYKYFGTVDWYQTGAMWLINDQKDGGQWRGKYGEDVATSYALLFLVRGRRPVLFNKLKYDGDWNNRPRDLASLTRWLSQAFEQRDINWQIINLEVAARHWHDAPILYISGAKRPKFTDEQLERIRRFVYQGGTILSVTECRGMGFSAGMREAYKKMFPRYELETLTRDDVIYQTAVQYDLGRSAGRLKLQAVSNGVRPLVIHTDMDLAEPWQLQRHETARWAFEAAANIAAYVTNKSFRTRGSKVWPGEPDVGDLPSVTVARLAFEGNHDPEPLAYQRFSRLMARKHGVKVNVIGPIDIAKLPETDASIAILSGTGTFKLTAEQQQILRDFVEGGPRVIVIDAAGGDEAFAAAAEEQIAAIYGPGTLRRLEASDPLFRLDGNVIETFAYRRRTAGRLPDKQPTLRAVRVAGRPVIYYSAEDITAGLVGYSSYVVDGYAPDTAFAIMRNIALQQAGAAAGSPE